MYGSLCFLDMPIFRFFWRCIFHGTASLYWWPLNIKLERKIRIQLYWTLWKKDSSPGRLRRRLAESCLTCQAQLVWLLDSFTFFASEIKTWKWLRKLNSKHFSDRKEAYPIPRKTLNNWGILILKISFTARTEGRIILRDYGNGAYSTSVGFLEWNRNGPFTLQNLVVPFPNRAGPVLIILPCRSSFFPV